MIRFSLTLPSQTLLRPVRVEGAMPYSFKEQPQDCRAVWCLHCAMEDGDFFFRNLSLAQYADKYGVALIAPSLGNGYFINSPYEKQADFLQQEFLPVLQAMLSLSPRKEDNMLLGISMGAFGGALWALRQPEVFSRVALVSGIFNAALPIDERAKRNREQRALVKLLAERQMPLLMQAPNGELREEADISALYERAAGSDAPMFRLWRGEKDYIAETQCENFLENCHKSGIYAALEITPGGHTLEYWKGIAGAALAWLASDESGERPDA